MANGSLNLLGGMASGFVGAKNQARQLNLMDEYRKAQTEQIKIQAKKAENALKIQELEAPIYQMIAEAAKRQGQTPSLVMQQQLSQGGGQPFAQHEPAQPSSQPIPDMIAAGQNQLSGMVKNTALSKGEDPNFALAMMRYESGGNPNAVSPKGAKGLFQFMPETGANYNLNNPYDPKANTVAFLAHTADNRNALINAGISPTPENLAAAHNAGVNAVIKYGGVPPYKETQQFTANVIKSLGMPQQTMTPQQAQGTTTPIQYARPPGGITGEKLLQGWLKKKYGIEPDEVKYQKMGSHLWVMDKQGGVLGVYPGQGEYKITEIKQPDGSVISTPVLTPPSPIPPGVPVFSMPGGGGGMAPPNAMFKQGIQTAPPEYTYQEVGDPGGAKRKIAVPKPQAGLEFATEPPKGSNSSEAGRIQLAQSGIAAYQELKNIIIDPKTGKSNWGALAASIGPGIPWTKGRQIKGLIMRATDTIVRAATGAALNQQELEDYAIMYSSSIFDNEDTVQSKMAGLERFLNGYLNKMDPTGASSLRTGISKEAIEKNKTKVEKPLKGLNAPDPLGLR